MGGSPNVSKVKSGTSTRIGTDIDDSSKTDKNVPLTESYKDFDENLDYDGDDYDPSVSDDVYNKPPASEKNKLDNVP